MLNDYEQEQLKAADEWKRQEPWIISKMFSGNKEPVVWVAKKIIPPSLVRPALENPVWQAAPSPELSDVLKLAQATNLEQLQKGDLQKLDQAAQQVQTWALDQLPKGPETPKKPEPGKAQPAAKPVDDESAGINTELFLVALRAVRRVAHCYGYSGEGTGERQFILGILSAVSSNSMAEKIEAVTRLKVLDTVIAKQSWTVALKKKGKAEAEDAAALLAGKTAARALKAGATKSDKPAERALDPAAKRAFESIEKKVEEGLLSVRDLATQMGINLTKRKVLQAIPFVVDALGPHPGVVFMKDVAQASRRAYQERWLNDKVRAAEIG
jgi:hypothetical protein